MYGLKLEIFRELSGYMSDNNQTYELCCTRKLNSESPHEIRGAGSLVIL